MREAWGHALVEYATALRMRERPSRRLVHAVYDALVQLRDDLAGQAVIERDIATLLAEFLATCWSSLEADERHPDVEQDLAVLSEAVIAALTPSALPPRPR